MLSRTMQPLQLTSTDGRRGLRMNRFAFDARDGANYAPGPVATEAGEMALRANIPVFVNSFNQLLYLTDTIDWLLRHGFTNLTIIDQASDYAPLLAYLGEVSGRGVKLVRLATNVGARLALAEAAVLTHLVPHIFTDPDLLLPETPDPLFVTRMLGLSMRFRAQKVGLALRIDDQHLFKPSRISVDGQAPQTILEIEGRFWEKRLAADVYRANVDTTFYLCNPQAPDTFDNSMRRLFGKHRKLRCIRVAGPGFLAKHRPWYVDDGWPEPEKVHYQQTAKAWTNWGLPSVA